MTSYLVRKIISKIFSYIPLPSLVPSDDPIDVVIPIISKDLKILPLCLEGIKACVTNKIANIYVVAPKIDDIVSFCNSEGLIYIDETSVLGITPNDLNLVINNGDGTTTNRSGWLFQQLLKLSGTIGTCENYLCIDADHILVKSHVFVTKDGLPVFYMSPELHLPYYKSIKKLSNITEFNLLSYVAHKMVFNKKQLMMMHKEIENKTGKEWKKAILDNYDRTQGAGFSEFEFYGNFIEKKHHRPWNHCYFSYKDVQAYPQLYQKYGKRYHCITFPDFMKDMKQ